MCPLCGGEAREIGSAADTRIQKRCICQTCGTVFIPVPCNGGVVFIQAKDVNAVTPNMEDF